MSIFPSLRDKRTRHIAYRILKRWVGYRKMNPRYTIHSSRHSYSMGLTRVGLNDDFITKLMGHSSRQSTLDYKHAELEMLLEAICKL